jgi:hypothetical protein
MYTIRIDNLDEYDGERAIELTLRDGINTELSQHNLKVGVVGAFPGRPELFVLAKFESTIARQRYGGRGKDKLLGFEDWIKVNNAVNKVLNDYGFYAHVKSGKFIVRIGKKCREDYTGGRTF